MNILLTGGAGYIGSHTYLSLLAAGYNPVILDDFSNSSPLVLEHLHRISGFAVLSVSANVLDNNAVRKVLIDYKICCVIHFAAYKSVGESVDNPLKYYDNNIGGMISLLKAMETVECKTIVFSSSATVYGDAAVQPITESAQRSHTNPYGHTKLVCEDVLASLAIADENWNIGILRYFNPVGAHDSGIIGEDSQGIPNNLMPYVAQVAVGKRQTLTVYGDDYPTRDGTGVRDYIHVMDLAEAHVAAAKHLLENNTVDTVGYAAFKARINPSFTLNIGTGVGCSVLDVVHAYRTASGQKIPYQIAQRRAGDVATCYADPTLAHSLLGWRARRNLANMCETSWKWQSMNPNGYATLS